MENFQGNKIIGTVLSNYIKKKLGKQDEVVEPKKKYIPDVDLVLTHKGRFRKVKKVYNRPYKGKIYHIIPRYFNLGLKTTDEHPFYAIKTHKNCSWTKGICKPTLPHTNYCVTNAHSNYTPGWIAPKNLSKGDVLLYPRLKETKDKISKLK